MNGNPPRLFLALLVGLVAPRLSLAESGQAVTLDLGPEGSSPGLAPVLIHLEPGTLGPGVYLVENGQARTIAQVFQDRDQLTLAMTPVPGLGNHPRVGPLPEGSVPQADQGVKVEPREGRVEITIGGQPFTAYRTAEAAKPYFYPVFGPGGVPMTRAYPMADVEGEDRDHPHQRSFWFTHGDVNGYDFWASDPLNRDNPRFGKIQEIEKVTVVSGPVVGVLRTRNAWLGPDSKPILEDDRRVRIYSSVSPRILDFEIRLTAGEEPVTFGDTKEGSFGLRVASTMDVKKKQGGRIVNAEGIQDAQAWGKASAWVDYTGPVGGKTMGIAILNHPSSFRFPTTWHVRDYGLFAANPFGYKDFGIEKPGAHTIAPGESIGLAYRVILHEGTTEEAGIADAFSQYSKAPVAIIEKP